MKSSHMETLQKYFHLPLEDAAQGMGICQTSLKRRCRELGIRRWPYRKVNSLNKQIEADELALGQRTNQRYKLEQRLATLKAQKDFIISNPGLDHDDEADIIQESESRILQQSSQTVFWHQHQVSATGRVIEVNQMRTSVTPPIYYSPPVNRRQVRTSRPSRFDFPNTRSHTPDLTPPVQRRCSVTPTRSESGPMEISLPPLSQFYFPGVSNNTQRPEWFETERMRYVNMTLFPNGRRSV